MAATKIAIFYASGSGMIRGVLVPDRDEDLTRCFAPKDETMIIVDAFASPEKGVFDPANHQYVIDQVAQAIGKAPPSYEEMRCAVVNKDTKIVESIILADEAIDLHPEGDLVHAYHPEVAPGCTFDPASGEFTVPARVEPPFVDKEGNLVPVKIVPEKPLPKEKP